MPLEDEELKLTVTLVDNATAGLRQLSQTMQQASRGAKDYNDSQAKQHKETNEHLKAMLELLEKGGKSVLPEFARGITGISTSIVGMAAGITTAVVGVLALGRAIKETAAAFPDFINKQVQMGQLQKTTGVTPAQQEVIEREYKQQLVPGGAETARADIQALSKDLAELQRVQNSIREAAVKGFIPQDVARQNLEQIERLRRATTAPEFINIAKEMYDAVEKGRIEVLRRSGRFQSEFALRAAGAQEAQGWAREQLGLQGVPYLGQAIPQATAEEEATGQARARRAREYAEATASIAANMERIENAINAKIADSPLLKAIQAIAAGLEAIRKWVESPPVQPTRRPRAETPEDAERYRRDEERAEERRLQRELAAAERVAQPFHRPGTRAPPVSPEAQAKVDALRAQLEALQAEHRKAEADRAAARAAAPPTAHPPGHPAGTGATGKPLHIQGYQEGGIVAHDTLALVHRGETIQPAETKGAIEDQTKASKDLTDEMRKLNRFLARTVVARMGGLPRGKGVGTGYIGGDGGGDGGGGGGDGALPSAGEIPSTGGPLADMLSGFGGGGGMLGGLLGGSGLSSLIPGGLGGGGGLGAILGGAGGLGGLLGGLLGGRGGLGGILGGRGIPGLPGSRGGGDGKVTGTGSGDGKSLGGSKQQVASSVTEALRKQGLSDNAIAGILYNVGAESGFDPTLRHADQPRFSGEAHFAHGLFQEGGDEWNTWAADMRSRGLDPNEAWKDPAEAANFVARRLKGTLGDKQYAQLYQQLQAAKSPAEAAALFAQHYLKPAKPYLQKRLADIGKGVPGLEHYTGGRGADGTGTAEAPTGGPLGAEADQKGRPYHFAGPVTVGGETFHYATGGAKRGSLPYGTFPVNVNDPQMGDIGRRIGAIATVGGHGGVIPDPKYPGEARGGIEIHSGSSNDLDRLYTEGCFGVPPAEWPRFKQALLREAQNGPLVLHVGRDGRAQIMTRSAWEKAGQGQTPQGAQPPPGLSASVPAGAARPAPGARPIRVPTHAELRGMSTQELVGGFEGADGEGATFPGIQRDTAIPSIDRPGINQRMTHQVEGTGHIHVHVDAPRGTKVAAKGGGLFKKASVNRRSSMEPAAVATTRVPTPAPAVPAYEE